MTLESETQLTSLANKEAHLIVNGTIQFTFATGDGSLVIPVFSVPG